MSQNDAVVAYTIKLLDQFSAEAKKIEAAVASLSAKTAAGSRAMAVGASMGAVALAELKAALIGLMPAITIAAAVYMLARQLKESVGEAEKAENAQRNLARAIKATGQAIEPVLRDFNEYAEAKMKSSGIDDEAIKGVLALATRMGLGAQQAKALADAAVDLGAKFGSTEGAALAMARAMYGNSRALVQYGLVLDPAKVKAGGLNYVLAEAKRLYGGAAEATDTYAQKMRHLTTRLSELKENIGGPIVSGLAKIADSFLDWFRIIDAGFKQSVDAAGAMDIKLEELHKHQLNRMKVAQQADALFIELKRNEQLLKDLRGKDEYPDTREGRRARLDNLGVRNKAFLIAAQEGNLSENDKRIVELQTKIDAQKKQLDELYKGIGGTPWEQVTPDDGGAKRTEAAISKGLGEYRDTLRAMEVLREEIKGGRPGIPYLELAKAWMEKATEDIEKSRKRDLDALDKLYPDKADAPLKEVQKDRINEHYETVKEAASAYRRELEALATRSADVVSTLTGEMTAQNQTIEAISQKKAEEIESHYKLARAAEDSRLEGIRTELLGYYRAEEVRREEEKKALEDRAKLDAESVSSELEQKQEEVLGSYAIAAMRQAEELVRLREDTIKAEYEFEQAVRDDSMDKEAARIRYLAALRNELMGQPGSAAKPEETKRQIGDAALRSFNQVYAPVGGSPLETFLQQISYINAIQENRAKLEADGIKTDILEKNAKRDLISTTGESVLAMARFAISTKQMSAKMIAVAGLQEVGGALQKSKNAYAQASGYAMEFLSLVVEYQKTRTAGEKNREAVQDTLDKYNDQMKKRFLDSMGMSQAQYAALKVSKKDDPTVKMMEALEKFGDAAPMKMAEFNKLAARDMYEQIAIAMTGDVQQSGTAARELAAEFEGLGLRTGDAVGVMGDMIAQMKGVTDAEGDRLAAEAAIFSSATFTADQLSSLAILYGNTLNFMDEEKRLRQEVNQAAKEYAAFVRGGGKEQTGAAWGRLQASRDAYVGNLIAQRTEAEKGRKELEEALINKGMTKEQAQKTIDEQMDVKTNTGTMVGLLRDIAKNTTPKKEPDVPVEHTGYNVPAYHMGKVWTGTNPYAEHVAKVMNREIVLQPEQYVERMANAYLNGVLDRNSGASGGGGQHFHFHGPVMGDERSAGRYVRRVIARATGNRERN